MVMSKIDGEYLKEHPGSKILYDKATKLFARGVTHDARFFDPLPIYCVKGKGSR